MRFEENGHSMPKHAGKSHRRDGLECRALGLIN